jgi:hypothetical protein
MLLMSKRYSYSLGPDVVLLRSRILKVGWWFSKQTGPHLRSGQIFAASDLPSESAQRWSDAWHGLHCSQRWGLGQRMDHNCRWVWHGLRTMQRPTISYLAQSGWAAGLLRKNGDDL